MKTKMIHVSIGHLAIIVIGFFVIDSNLGGPDGG